MYFSGGADRASIKKRTSMLEALDVIRIYASLVCIFAARYLLHNPIAQHSYGKVFNECQYDVSLWCKMLSFISSSWLRLFNELCVFRIFLRDGSAFR